MLKRKRVQSISVRPAKRRMVMAAAMPRPSYRSKSLRRRKASKSSRKRRVKRVRKSKKKVSDLGLGHFRKSGFTRLTENGIVTTETQLAVAGMTTIFGNVMNDFVFALLHKLLNKAGIHVQNWNDLIPYNSVTTYRFRMFYINDNTVTVRNEIGRSTPGTVTDTWNGFALDITSSIDAALQNKWRGNILSFELHSRNTSDGVDDFTLRSSIGADTLSCDYYSGLKLIMQNQTKNDSQTNDTDVSNPNPIVGKCFIKNGNVFIKAGKTVSGNESLPRGHVTTGLIGFAQPSGGNQNQKAEYHKVHKSSFWKNVRKTVALELQPGQSATISDTRIQHFGSIEAFFTAMGDYVHTVAEGFDVQMGNAIMFEFEKKIDSREAVQSSVVVANQCEFTSGMVINVKKKQPVPTFVTVF